MRGADAAIWASIERDLETSPHAWSRLIIHDNCARGEGNISTCVEQTYPKNGNRLCW